MHIIIIIFIIYLKIKIKFIFFIFHRNIMKFYFTLEILLPKNLNKKYLIM